MSARVPGAPERDRSGAWWGAVALGGLALAFFALARPVEAPVQGSAVPILVRLPDALVGAVVVLFALGAVLLLVLLAPRARRRKRKGDDEFEPYYEPPRVSPWALLLMWALLLAPLGAVAYLVWTGSFPDLDGAGLLRPRSARPLIPGDLRFPPERPTTSLPVFTSALGAVALLVAIGAFGFVVWLFAGDRIARWWAGPLSGEEREPLVEAVDESLDDLRQETDPRRAVIKVYRRFEAALAASGFPRAPWETPTEFMRDALGRFPLPAEAVAALTELFQLARFSDHRLGLKEHDAAVVSLMKIEAALEQAGSDAAPA